jgi:hypothetical protein
MSAKVDRRDSGTDQRVGFAPDSCDWADWESSQEHGRLAGHWDDQIREFRTTCVAESALACLLELLPTLRLSPR